MIKIYYFSWGFLPLFVGPFSKNAEVPLCFSKCRRRRLRHAAGCGSDNPRLAGGSMALRIKTWMERWTNGWMDGWIDGWIYVEPLACKESLQAVWDIFVRFIWRMLHKPCVFLSVPLRCLFIRAISSYGYSYVCLKFQGISTLYLEGLAYRASFLIPTSGKWRLKASEGQ